MRLDRFRFCTIALLLCAHSLLHSQTEAAPAPVIEPATTVTAEQYRDQLRHVSEGLNAPSVSEDQVRQLLVETPEKYTVSTKSGTVEVDNAWLRDGLAKLAVSDEKKRQESLASLRKALDARVSAVEGSLSSDHSGTESAGSVADSVLAGSEFHRVHKPEVWRSWIQKLLQYVVRGIDAIARQSGKVPWLGRAFVWGIIGISCVALALWLHRLLRNTAGEPAAREPLPFIGERKGWRKWLRDAYAAAESGNFREAVHCAYWAAIARLEEAGSWRIDRARTPREYVSLLQQAHPMRGNLLEVTRRFEVIWYGNRPAASGDFEFIRSKVEGMR